MLTLKSALFVLVPFLVAASDAATPPSVEFDVYVECKCTPRVQLEYHPDFLPWNVSWAPDPANQFGVCKFGYCELFDARPCDGSFAITISYVGNTIPAPPCTGESSISYDPEGDGGFESWGVLNDVTPSVTKTGVGKTKIECKKVTQGFQEEREADADVSEISVACGTGGNQVHQRKVTIREVCQGCEGTPKVN
jgi:hypothetical protein